jgi:cytochrome c-type biogenesis protein CcmH/NrfF
MVTPPLVCVAWLLLAGELLANSVMWWAAPVGLTALVVGAIARADRRRRDLPVTTPELVALEYAGMAAILLPPLVETATISPVRGLIGIGFGLAIVGWALVSRVRRRLFVGAGAIVAIVLVMILGQVADLIPRIEGPTLWAVIVAAGFVLIVIATSIERGRARAAEAIAKLNELLDGWE